MKRKKKKQKKSARSGPFKKKARLELIQTRNTKKKHIPQDWPKHFVALRQQRP
jgi:hypothetical protein